jgi:fructokinase
MSARFDVFAVGNALVDAEYRVDDRFLRDQGLEKGHMMLVDEARQRQLAGAVDLQPVTREPGGSAANTAIAVAGFGGNAYYACRVADDADGHHFVDSLAAARIATQPVDGSADGRTGTCLIFITADGERTMSTCLGVSAALHAGVVDARALPGARFAYLEGYLAASPSARDAAVRARTLAEDAAVRTALTLSDANMVTHFRDGLEQMLGNGTSLLFCNVEEALLWARTDRLDVARQELRDVAATVFVTLGARGALVCHGRQGVEVEGFPVKPLDTNGAGDIFAGAVLRALAEGHDAVPAARFGNFAASRLVLHVGPRLPLPRYADLVRQFRP